MKTIHPSIFLTNARVAKRLFVHLLTFTHNPFYLTAEPANSLRQKIIIHLTILNSFTNRVLSLPSLYCVFAPLRLKLGESRNTLLLQQPNESELVVTAEKTSIIQQNTTNRCNLLKVSILPFTYQEVNSNKHSLCTTTERSELNETPMKYHL